MLFNPLSSASLSSSPLLAAIAQLTVSIGSPLAIITPAPFTPLPIPHPGQQLVKLLFELLSGDCHQDLDIEMYG
jgi:hypothetical protein